MSETLARCMEKVEQLQDWQIAIKNCVKSAGLDGLTHPSFNDFINKANEYMQIADNAYYDGCDTATKHWTDKAINVLQQAQIWNQHIGL